MTSNYGVKRFPKGNNIISKGNARGVKRVTEVTRIIQMYNIRLSLDGDFDVYSIHLFRECEIHLG